MRSDGNSESLNRPSSKSHKNHQKLPSHLVETFDQSGQRLQSHESEIFKDDSLTSSHFSIIPKQQSREHFSTSNISNSTSSKPIKLPHFIHYSTPLKSHIPKQERGGSQPQINKPDSKSSNQQQYQQNQVPQQIYRQQQLSSTSIIDNYLGLQNPIIVSIQKGKPRETEKQQKSQSPMNKTDNSRIKKQNQSQNTTQSLFTDPESFFVEGGVSAPITSSRTNSSMLWNSKQYPSSKQSGKLRGESVNAQKINQIDQFSQSQYYSRQRTFSHNNPEDPSNQKQKHGTSKDFYKHQSPYNPVKPSNNYNKKDQRPIYSVSQFKSRSNPQNYQESNSYEINSYQKTNNYPYLQINKKQTVQSQNSDLQIGQDTMQRPPGRKKPLSYSMHSEGFPMQGSYSTKRPMMLTGVNNTARKTEGQQIKISDLDHELGFSLFEGGTHEIPVKQMYDYSNQSEPELCVEQFQDIPTEGFSEHSDITSENNEDSDTDMNDLDDKSNLISNNPNRNRPRSSRTKRSNSNMVEKKKKEYFEDSTQRQNTDFEELCSLKSFDYTPIKLDLGNSQKNEKSEKKVSETNITINRRRESYKPNHNSIASDKIRLPFDSKLDIDFIRLFANSGTPSIPTGFEKKTQNASTLTKFIQLGGENPSHQNSIQNIEDFQDQESGLE